MIEQGYILGKEEKEWIDNVVLQRRSSGEQPSELYRRSALK
jgi:hypothetical protein